MKRNNNIFQLLLLIVSAVGLLLGLLLVRNNSELRSRAGLGGNQYSAIRSITWYDPHVSPVQSNENLKKALPAIKAAGFNTVWLVNQWSFFNPDLVASPPVYYDRAFTLLKNNLDILRANNMQAIVGLNYLGEGWAPKGIDACTWITNPTMYQAFVGYATTFLERISAYSDMVYILVFTENAIPCNLMPIYEEANAKQAAGFLRATLGNFPKQLPSELRSKFRIGYHDYPLINLGWARGEVPIASPNPFDFVSMVGYALDDTAFETKPDAQIRAILDTRRNRFLAAFPTTPLVMGEYGANHCNGQDDNQARVVGTATRWALEQKMGFNLWKWSHDGANECTATHQGLAITNANGSENKAASMMRILLATIVKPTSIPVEVPVAQFAGLTQTYSPWAVWVTGEKLAGAKRVRLFDKGAPWGKDIPLTHAADESFISFSLPANSPLSQCNINATCTVGVALVTDDGRTSNTIQLLLAKVVPLKITDAGLTTSYSPWAVWVIGDNLAGSTLKAQLFDRSVRWGGDIPVTVAADKSFASFRLPANSPPSVCNKNQACTVGVRFVDSVSGAVSNTYQLSLPVSK